MQTTILVVDDTATCRRPMERLLKTEGYATCSATNGIEAMDALRSFLPDLILLDLNMPLMDGFEVLTRLRQTPALAALPVIVVTAEVSPDCEVRAKRLGARGVLKKGAFSPEELFASIRRELAAEPALPDPPERCPPSHEPKPLPNPVWDCGASMMPFRYGGAHKSLGETHTEAATTCIMHTTSTDGALYELVILPDGSIGVTRNHAPVGSRRFTSDEFTECIDLLHRTSGRKTMAGRSAPNLTEAG